MITVLLNDSGEKVTVNAEPSNVTIETGALIARRDRQVIARFRRHLAWWETPQSEATDD